MMKVRNLGRKSLKEVVQKLREIGLDLKNSSTLFDDDDDADFDDEDGNDSEESSNTNYSLEGEIKYGIRISYFKS